MPLNSKFEANKENIIARKAGKSYLENVEITSNVDTSKEGTYEVIYSIEIDNKVHTRKRIITIE
ncbi:immunoglobulin-like domain-containing protein [Gemelliphila palaticanis]|uniref:immunoglobulin-like domain-containing protein n=1 Tax=Gemelliphila palaticanis TaxID=81950 RepID=UPI003F6A0F60